MDSVQRFWNKKTIISYFLCILVFFIHISAFANYDNTGTDAICTLNNLVLFVTHGLFTPFAVPLFFILSGFAFFRNYNNSLYFSKLKSRIKSLLIPYWVWNIVWTVFAIVTSYTFISIFFLGRGKFEITPWNLFLSVFHHYNTPYWFIFNLMFFCVCAPVIYFLLKNKVIACLVLIAIPVLIANNVTLPYAIFYRSDSIFFFIVGAACGIHLKDFFTKKSSIIEIIISICIFVFCCFISGLSYYGFQTFPSFFEPIYLLLFSLSFWKMADIFIDRIKIRPFFTRSFMVYLMHINVSAVITKLLYLILPKSNWWTIPNVVLTVFLTLASINLFCVFMQRFFPKVYMYIGGTRG